MREGGGRLGLEGANANPQWEDCASMCLCVPHNLSVNFAWVMWTRRTWHKWKRATAHAAIGQIFTLDDASAIWFHSKEVLTPIAAN